MKINFTIQKGNGIIKRIGFALLIVIQNSRGNRLHNVYTTKLKFYFLFQKGNGIMKITGFALITRFVEFVGFDYCNRELKRI